MKNSQHAKIVNGYYNRAYFWNSWHETGGLIGLNNAAELLDIARPNIDGICEKNEIKIYEFPHSPSRKFIGIKDYYKLQLILATKTLLKSSNINDIADLNLE